MQRLRLAARLGRSSQDSANALRNGSHGYRLVYFGASLPHFSNANAGIYVGPSCHWHAITRFFKAFRFALAMYLPLQLLLRMRHPSPSQLQKACREAARSSAFLGTFVALFYYGVCLSRTRLGPRLVSKEIVTPLMWDSGLCVRAGCILCGWSILIEAERRRQELAMFVVPRAAATLFPRRYDKKASRPSCLALRLSANLYLQHFWMEKAAFSLSTATLFTLAHQSSKNVRGILGGVLHAVIA